MSFQGEEVAIGLMFISSELRDPLGVVIADVWLLGDMGLSSSTIRSLLHDGHTGTSFIHASISAISNEHSKDCANFRGSYLLQIVTQ